MTGALHFAARLGRFLAAGLPGFAAAFVTNFLLVDKLHWPKSVSYLIVLWLQVTINFFSCRLFVFEPGSQMPVYRQYAHFLSGIGAIRLVEWLFYMLLVEVFHLYYLAVQSVNLVLFALIKFKFSESLFERKLGGQKKQMIRTEGEAP